MIKQIELIKRKQNLSREAFSRHYEEVFAPLMLTSSPSIKRYVRNHIISPLAGGEPDFDCVTEVWFEDMDGFKANVKLYSSEAGKVIRDELEKFVDTSKIVAFLVQETVTQGST